VKKARNLMIVRDRVVEGQSHRKLAEKYGLSYQRIGEILNQENYKEVEKQWRQEVMKAHFLLGTKALTSLDKLLDPENPDPYTVNNFFKRMGIDQSSPQIEMNIQELKMEAPPELTEVLGKLAKEQEKVNDEDGA
jgi:hypothetical protein